MHWGEVKQEGAEWHVYLSSGQNDLWHERLESRCWKEVSRPTIWSACALPHPPTPPTAAAVPQIHLTLRPTVATFSHSAYPCLWGSFLDFFPHPGKLLVSSYRGNAPQTLIKSKSSLLWLSLWPPTPFFIDLILDLKITRHICSFCGLFLWAGLLELLVSPLGFCDFLVCNYVSPGWTAWRTFMLSNLCLGYLTAKGCHHRSTEIQAHFHCISKHQTLC